MTEQTQDITNEETTATEQVAGETCELTAKIAELEAQVKEAKDAAVRANAESYNAQRRMEQETDKAKNSLYKSSPKSYWTWWIT